MPFAKLRMENAGVGGHAYVTFTVNMDEAVINHAKDEFTKTISLPELKELFKQLSRQLPALEREAKAQEVGRAAMKLLVDRAFTAEIDAYNKAKKGSRR